ncbi:uncharacterized protein CLUP02_13885 [Colletotrichum lupini]|uniref:Uncharacterized protein n=1 Tax=Colletotrichum lupini TaxID=145971 RepID=A0A9Q8T3B8_9PEZI|nr:uncharacterized protein CLUP02_13885 [Colletotrichum lupini]UQC88362.1 hypothetical protein CLUP02_13885 [Colletotrichum lupini]
MSLKSRGSKKSWGDARRRSLGCQAFNRPQAETFFFLPAVAAFAGYCAMLSTTSLHPSPAIGLSCITAFSGLIGSPEGTYSGEMTMDLPSPVFFPSVPRRITTPFPSGRCTLDVFTSPFLSWFQTLQVAE